MNKKQVFKIIFAIFFVLLFSTSISFAFWIWTPKTKTMVNPKFAVKDTPREQFDWAIRFYKQGDFQRSADEFARLVQYYPDSDFAPDAQYYVGRSYEELAKYFFAFQNYQKTLDDYPYTKRMEEIIEREFNIANIFQNKESAKLVDLELTLALEKAETIYKKVVENNPFGRFADKALYRLAECYRRMMKYDEAIKSYERIISDYPESRIVQEAKYQLAYTKYEASLSPEYDQESTDKALEVFQEISKSTAVPKVAEEAGKMLGELKTKKAESVLKVANFYERQGKFASAIMYYEEVLGKFEGTDAAKFASEKITNLKQRIKK